MVVQEHLPTPKPLHSALNMLNLPLFLQVERLLQKFLESDVIVEVRGKLKKFSQEGGYLYQFVTKSGPLNFLKDGTEGESSGQSPLGKHPRSKSVPYDGTLIANEYAFVKCDDGPSKPKQPRLSGAGASKLAVFDVNSRSTKLSPVQVAGVWKELTLAR